MDNNNNQSFDVGLKKMFNINRLSSLRRYLFLIGKSADPKKIPAHELNKIEKSSRYKQWKILKKMQRLAQKVKQQNNESFDEELRNFDSGDLSHRHVPHKPHNSKLKFLKQQSLDIVNSGLGNIETSPGAITTKNVKAKHAFTGIGKGKILIRKSIGHKPQHTIQYREAVEDDTNLGKISNKTQKLLDKSKELNSREVHLRGDDVVEINPILRTLKTNLDKKE